MRRLGGLLLGLAMIVGAGVIPGVASAGGGYATVTPIRPEQSSVFPVPPDPWRNWGVRDRGGYPGGGYHYPAGHYYPGGYHTYPGTPYQVVVPSTARWVPGYWQWNGYQWLWTPGYWVW